MSKYSYYVLLNNKEQRQRKISMEVKQLSNSNCPKCQKSDTIARVYELLTGYGCSLIPVVTDDEVVEGIVSLESLTGLLLKNVPADTPIAGYIEEPILAEGSVMLNTIIDLPLQKVVIVDDDNRLTGMISPNKLAYNLLNQRDSASCNLNAILDTSNNGIVSIDASCRITYLNKSTAKLLNVKVEDTLGRHIEEIIPDTNMPEIVRTGKPEIASRFRHGDKIFITNRTPIIQDGRIVGAVAVFQDITELQNVMEELTNVKKYKDTLETVVDNDYDCIVVVDPDGYITMFNQAYEKFLGLPREKAIGRHVTEVIDNTRMHIVAKTGQAEMAELQKIKGEEMICNRIPIIKDGKTWGAVGKTMFKTVKEFTFVVDKFKKLQGELDYYKDVVKKIQGAYYTFDQIIGSSPEMTEVKNMARRVSRTSSSVLIRGGSGTGKELFANAIHYASDRKNSPFVKVNCSAIPENLMESELFGYSEGAFTGAKKGGKPGKCELAHTGTLFLDEVGDMPVNMQVKLLRFLQEKEFERVGGNTPITVDVRVVAATNRNLEELIKEDRFRLDLYYRLNVVELKIPPLRYHKSDIPELVHYLFAKLSEKMGCIIPEIDREAMGLLLNYHWPGNVRELENVLERCLNFMDRGVIRVNNLPYHIRNATRYSENTGLRLTEHIQEAERMVIVNTLKTCGGNREQAAKLLGISRAGIYQKIARYNIR